MSRAPGRSNEGYLSNVGLCVAGTCCGAVTLSPTRLDYLSQVLLRRTTTEMPSADANAYECGQKTCAGDGGALYLGLELHFLLYYAPPSCAHFGVEPVFSGLVGSRLLLFWAAMLTVVRDLVFWHVEEI